MLKAVYLTNDSICFYTEKFYTAKLMHSLMFFLFRTVSLNMTRICSTWFLRSEQGLQPQQPALQPHQETDLFFLQFASSVKRKT